MTSSSIALPFRSAAAAAVVGGLSLIEPRALGPWSRAAYRTGVAGASGLLLADSTRDQDAILSPGLDGALLGAATLGLMDLSEHLDAQIVDAMRRRGISRPRLVLAALGAAGTVAMYALEARRAPQDPGVEPADDDEERELPAPVRELVALLLAAPEEGADLPGAPALRAQLSRARDHGPAEQTGEVWFSVPDTYERAVPRYQTWPVRGVFTQRGHRLQAELQIDDGQLSMFSILPADGVEGDAVDAALEHLAGPEFSLPAPEEIEIVHENAAP
ncbi:hypothetical protein [Brachybacterium saurashtrense]|uniref:Uncharacterized protein n=1 Tax=Brachybacterium saurashtrense TaxID=556288 RepID=A0A345YKF5_9MICO|nr:hypothetical protein [Brachybacterium saurashtrense]AXK44407.1 hypothetical protein DWV08_01400 [Brachybacterium saurashtrense]RRR23018.1 hypothetical protein DXU92_06530 [Brachybacterium saurashtrense]